MSLRTKMSYFLTKSSFFLGFQGQFFSGSAYRIYLLGNPIIWWGNLVFLFVFILVFGVNCVRQQRGYLGSFSGRSI